MKKVIASNNAPAAIGPYSQAIEAAGLVFASGQLPVDPASGQIPEGIEAQAKNSLSNLSAVLQAAGCTMDDVVKTTVFLADMADFSAVNAVYGEMFSAPFPSRSCFQVAKLPKDAKIEIEAIAVKP